MKAFVFARFTALVAAAGLALSGCGPLTSLACERAYALCPNVDFAACDATLDLQPPRTRSDIVGCTAAAKGCDEVVACFTRNQLRLATVQ